MTEIDQGQPRTRRSGALESRVDPAHLGPSPGLDEASYAEGSLLEERPAKAVFGEEVDDPAALFVAQVQNQASQLAEQLQSRQDNLDRREAELHARLAAVDNQARSARLWVDQRQEEFEERVREIEKREAILARRLDEWGLSVESADDPRNFETHLTRRVAEIHAREARLRQREEELERLEREHERLAAQLDVRARSLEKSESFLQNEQSAQAAARGQIEAERVRWDEQRLKQQEELLSERDRCDRELKRMRQSLEQRADDLDQREARLEQLQAALVESQRENLEVRLATEEIWSEISQSVDSVEFNRRVTQIRSRLADHYGLARSDLAERHDELRRLAAEVVAQHERLKSQQSEFEHFIERRKGELEQQAARLVARERDWQQRQSHWDDERRGWADEKMEYQREIRRLGRKLGAALEPDSHTDCRSSGAAIR